MKGNLKSLEKSINHKALFLFVLTLLLVTLILQRTPNDTDMWWHLSAGSATWERGEILMEDIFSYTRTGEPWTNAFWLPDLLMFLIWSMGGFFAIAISGSFLAVLTIAIVYAHARGPLPIRIGVILLATLVLAAIWAPRPQVISIFFLVVLDYFLSQKDESLKKPFWLMIPLFILWANCHGGFIVGFLLLGAFIASKLIEPLIRSANDWLSWLKIISPVVFFTFLSIFAVGINPNGLAILKLPFYTLDVALLVEEWNSPDFHRLDLHPVLWMLFLWVTALGFSSKKVSFFDLFKTLGFAYLALYAQRNIALFAVIAAPVIVRYLSPVWDDLKSAPVGLKLERLQRTSAGKPIANRFTKTINLSVAALLFTVILLRAYTLSLPVFIHQRYPQAAINWIKANHPKSQMFNAYNWGGYLSWQLDEYPVFIDGRTDLYGDEIVSQWWSIIRATDESFDLLDQWEVNFVLLEPSWPIVEALKNENWSVQYEDNISVILEKSR